MTALAVPLEAPGERARRAWPNRLRHLMGLRQTLRIGGVRYRELDAASLRQALSRNGPAYKEYDVAFAGGGSMRIRCSRERVYADLMGPRLLAACGVVEPFLRPGMRVLLPQGGTGYLGEWAARYVAPSGAVVSLEADAESVQYAQRRYRLPNVSFELGGLEAVAGETNGSFDAVIAIEPLAAADNEAAAAAEWWRLVRPGGWLMAAAKRPAAATLTAIGPSLAGSQEPRVLVDARDAWGVVLFPRPDEQDRE